jgi:hypothetical protein
MTKTLDDLLELERKSSLGVDVSKELEEMAREEGFASYADWCADLKDKIAPSMKTIAEAVGKIDRPIDLGQVRHNPIWEGIGPIHLRQFEPVATYAPALPEVTDPTDKRILEWVTQDPDLKDKEIGQRLGISRQAVNPRRKKLEAMGYKVR